MIEDQLIDESNANKEKYQEFQIRLNQSKTSKDTQEPLSAEYTAAQDIYSQLKSLEGPIFFKRAILFALIIGSLASIIHLVINGLGIGAVTLALLLICSIINKVVISNKIQKVSKSKLIGEANGVENSQLPQFIQYVKYGIELKEMRFIMLAIILGLAMISICLTVGDLLFGPTGLLEIFLAILAGFLLVYAVFIKDLFDLSRMKERINGQVEGNT